ncbi:hypothetical protein FRC11_002019, partial [Ceratobasidium sp. 423]
MSLDASYRDSNSTIQDHESGLYFTDQQILEAFGDYEQPTSVLADSWEEEHGGNK